MAGAPPFVPGASRRASAWTWIATDERSVDGLFAVGDVHGGPHFTYVSVDDNGIVWDQLMGVGNRGTADRVAVPRGTFATSPHPG